MQERQILSFGLWLKAQRRRQRLTQEQFARRIHCATVTVRKLEASERLPSRQLAELLAHELGIAPPSHEAFMEFARTGRSAQTIVLGVETGSPDARPPMRRFAPEHLQARAAYLIDAGRDQLLLDIQGEQRMPIASTTKIMTALIAIEQADLRQRVTVRQAILDQVSAYDEHRVQLHADDQISLQDLLYAMMLPSSNDAAFVVADAIGGSVREFVKLMNHYAQRLHYSNTFYVNPSGIACLNTLDDVDAQNYSTAADLVHLTHYARSHPLFAQIVQHQYYKLASSPLHHAYIWETTNPLLSSYAGATGVKTGYASEAGHCLVFSATNAGQQLIGAILRERDKQQRTLDARRLLDWGFGASAS